MEKLTFKPLPSKVAVKKKKKKGRSKKKEETVSSPKHVSPIMVVPSEYESKDRKSTRLNSSHSGESRMPSSA